MLARRELSTTQLRDRLCDRGVTAPAADAAIEKLRSAGAVDDRRTALAYARQALTLKQRGRRRVLREVRALGIDRSVAETAVEEVYAGVDERELVEQVVARRHSGPIDTPAAVRRAYQALYRQGFESGTIVSVLKAHGAAVKE